VGKAFTAPIVESALGSYPGMFPTAPPAEGSPYGVYWPTSVPAGLVTQSVHLDDGSGDAVLVGTFPSGTSLATADTVPDVVVDGPPGRFDAASGRVALGTFVGARSGDKGGDANIGLWVRRSGHDDLDAARYHWLRAFVTPERVHDLLPESAGRAVEVHPLPRLCAVNVVVHGLLGRGVADSTSLDPQAKGLGEHVRARVVDIPAELLGDLP
jgi:hypothetical protein